MKPVVTFRPGQPKPMAKFPPKRNNDVHVDKPAARHQNKTSLFNSSFTTPVFSWNLTAWRQHAKKELKIQRKVYHLSSTGVRGPPPNFTTPEFTLNITTLRNQLEKKKAELRRRFQVEGKAIPPELVQVLRPIGGYSSSSTGLASSFVQPEILNRLPSIKKPSSSSSSSSSTGRFEPEYFLDSTGIKELRLTQGGFHSLAYRLHRKGDYKYMSKSGRILPNPGMVFADDTEPAHAAASLEASVKSQEKAIRRQHHFLSGMPKPGLFKPIEPPKLVWKTPGLVKSGVFEQLEIEEDRKDRLSSGLILKNSEEWAAHREQRRRMRGPLILDVKGRVQHRQPTKYEAVRLASRKIKGVLPKGGHASHRPLLLVRHPMMPYTPPRAPQWTNSHSSG